MSDENSKDHGAKELLAGCSCLTCLRRTWRIEVQGELHVPAGQQRGVAMVSRVHETRQTEAEARVSRRLIRGLTVRPRRRPLTKHRRKSCGACHGDPQRKWRSDEQP